MQSGKSQPPFLKAEAPKSKTERKFYKDDLPTVITHRDQNPPPFYFSVLSNEHDLVFFLISKCLLEKQFQHLSWLGVDSVPTSPSCTAPDNRPLWEDCRPRAPTQPLPALASPARCRVPGRLLPLVVGQHPASPLPLASCIRYLTDKISKENHRQIQLSPCVS